MPAHLTKIKKKTCFVLTTVVVDRGRRGVVGSAENFAMYFCLIVSVESPSFNNGEYEVLMNEVHQ